MSAEIKYDHFIWFQSTTDGIAWHIARRDSKRVVTSGTACSYDEAVRASEQAFKRYL